MKSRCSLVLAVGGVLSAFIAVALLLVAFSSASWECAACGAFALVIAGYELALARFARAKSAGDDFRAE